MTPADVLHLFNVDLEAGKLFWKRPPNNHSELAGKEAGRPIQNRKKRYWVTKINRTAWKRGRLIFLVARGRLPSPCLDHINGDSLDDRIVNLREATVTQNAWNHKTRAKPTAALPMGVRITANGSFQARIAVNKKKLHLGTFATVVEAESAYKAARIQHFGEFA